MNTPRLSAATRSAGWSFGPLLLGASVGRGRLDFRRIITSPTTWLSARPTFRQMLSDLIILTAGVIVAYNCASAFDTVIREAERAGLDPGRRSVQLGAR